MLTDFDRCLFLPRTFLGTASGQFLRPAASWLLLSWFLPNDTGPSLDYFRRLGHDNHRLLSKLYAWEEEEQSLVGRRNR
jgi:hypothetical protein